MTTRTILPFAGWAALCAGMLSCSTGRSSATLPVLAPSLGQVSTRCNVEGPSRHVWVFKQWHVAPSVKTDASGAGKPLPQAANQTAIFRQLDAWISEGRLREIYAEGCSGELEKGSQVSFNGWTIEALERAGNRSDYAEIVSHVPLKLEARHGKRLRTICGDDPELLKANAAAFSDARGTLGFLTRLVQYRGDPKRARTYLDGVIELYKLPPSTTVEQGIARVKQELRGAVARAREAIDARNARLVEQVLKSGEPDVAVVFGGMHAQGIVAGLEKAGVGCTVVEPSGYTDDEPKLLRKLEDELKETR